jgi:cellulose synthase/poly-beta-1,6-N-acetylglucosamine synthase-like glycosyltransferase
VLNIILTAVSLSSRKESPWLWKFLWGYRGRTSRLSGQVPYDPNYPPNPRHQAASDSDTAWRAREQCQTAGLNAEIIVVDDGSSDKTARNATAAGARVLRRRSNRGYGAALKSGIAAAANEYIVITMPTGRTPVASSRNCYPG